MIKFKFWFYKEHTDFLLLEPLNNLLYNLKDCKKIILYIAIADW